MDYYFNMGLITIGVIAFICSIFDINYDSILNRLRKYPKAQDLFIRESRTLKLITEKTLNYAFRIGMVALVSLVIIVIIVACIAYLIKTFNL